MNDAYDDDAVGWDSLVGYPDPNVTIPVSYEAFVEEWNSEMVYVFDRQGGRCDDYADVQCRQESGRIRCRGRRQVGRRAEARLCIYHTKTERRPSSAGVSTDTVHTVSYMTR